MSSPEPLPEAALLAETAWLRRLARHMVGEEDADDLVQDACVAALERPPKDPSRLRGWLAQVVRNAVRARYRDRLRRLRREAVAAREEAEPEGEDVVVRAETQQRVVASVLSLDEPYRTTILLRFFDDLPPRKVAERMGVPVATVHTRLRRGFDLLRRRLAERGRSWALVLLPLLARDGRLGALLAAGGAVMSKKAALLGAAAVLGLCLASVVWLSRAADEPRRELAVAPPPAGEGQEATEPGGGAVAVEGRVRLRGRVVDGDGVGIAGARVDLMPGLPVRYLECLRPVDLVRRDWDRVHSPQAPRTGATCDTEGRFDLSADTMPGDFLFVRAPGYAVETETGLSLLRSATGIEIRLKRQVACRVRVVDEEGAAVAGARVSLLSGLVLLARAETDAEGRIDFAAEPRGTGVLVEHAGHPAARGWIRDEKQEEVEVRLRTARVIEGVVLRSLDRAPVEGAAICVDVGVPCLAATDAKGRFRLECGDLAWWPAPAVVVDAGPAGVAAIPIADLPPNPLEILLHPATTLEGRLMGAMPLEGLRVFALQPGLPWREARVDAKGAFRIDGAAADVPVRLVFDPWNPSWEEAGEAPLKVSYETWGGYAVLELNPKAALEGRVTDERGDPVCGAKLALEAGGARGGFIDGIGFVGLCAGDAYSDGEGWFRIDGVTTRFTASPKGSPGITRMQPSLRAAAPGFVWREEGPFTLEPGEERTGLLFRLERGLVLTGRVVMEDGTPPPRVKVRASEVGADRDDNRHTGWAYSDEDGAYRIGGLPPGGYYVGVWDDAFQPAWHTGVAAGGEAPLLVLKTGATLEGVVQDEAGKGLRGHVQAWCPGIRSASGEWTKPDGRFELHQLEPGAYDVNVSAPGYLGEQRKGVTAPSSDLRFVLRRGLSLTGRIVRADGTPLRRVNIQAERTEPRRIDLPGSTGQASVDDDGRFEITGLSEGEFRLTFEKRTQDESVLRPVGGIAAGTEIVIRAEVGKFIEGRVVDQDGKPKARVRVEAAPLEPEGYVAGATSCGDDGRFRVGPLKGLRFTLVAGFGAEYGFAPDAEAGATDASIVMGRGDVIAGKAVDKDGNPTGASLAFTHEKIAHTWQYFTRDGRFRMEGVPPGTYFVHASPPNAMRMGPGGTEVQSGTLDAVLTVK